MDMPASRSTKLDSKMVECYDSSAVCCISNVGGHYSSIGYCIDATLELDFKISMSSVTSEFC